MNIVNWIKRVIKNIDIDIYWFFNGKRVMREYDEEQARERAEEEANIAEIIASYNEEQRCQQLERDEAHRKLLKKLDEADRARAEEQREFEDQMEEDRHRCCQCGDDDRHCNCNEDPRDYYLGDR